MERRRQSTHHKHNHARHLHPQAEKLDARVARGLAIIRSAVSPVSPAYVAAVLAEGDAIAKMCDERRAARKEQKRVIAAEKKGVTVEETAEDRAELQRLWEEHQSMRQDADKKRARIQRAVHGANPALHDRL